VSGELVRAGKRRENGEKEGDAVAKATVLNRRDEVGDSQRKGTTWRARAERGAERGGDRWTAPRPCSADRGPAAARAGGAICFGQGRGGGADARAPTGSGRGSENGQHGSSH
jgi:hypothetical protein